MRTVKLNDGKEYPIYFDFNVVAEAQERYGDISSITEKMKTLKELRWLTAQAINEGIAKKNYDSGTNDHSVSEFEIGVKIPLTESGIQSIGEAIVKAFNDCMGTTKNAGAAMDAADGTTKQNLTAEPKAQ